jgi:glycosyltransferase involved in cell wall biosynthesis
MDKVKFLYPSAKSLSIFPRQVVKLYIAIKVALSDKPDLIIGYHLFPNALFAHFISLLINAKSCYQLTSGEHQISGGGWQSENPIASGLQKPTPSIESLLISIVKKIDCIIVRGNRAEQYIKSINYPGYVEIITGSVNEHSALPAFKERAIDIIFVGRLVNVKNPKLILDIAYKLKSLMPKINLVFLGGGPLLEELTRTTEEMGLDSNVSFLGRVNNVEEYLLKSKTFILTSDFEGVSIAMLEAMSCGVVPVVNNVGDLDDVITDGVNGYLINKCLIEDYISCFQKLLLNESEWKKFSTSANKFVCENSGINSVKRKWKRLLHGI